MVSTAQQTASGLDLDTAVDFLDRLHPGGSWVLTVIDPDTEEIETETFTSAETKAAKAFIEQQNRRGRNVYYSPNPLRRNMSKKPKKVDVARIEYLFADLDPRDNEPPEEAKLRYRRALQQFEPKPSAIIDSGNGIQPLWRLDPPILLGKPVLNNDGKLVFSAGDQAKIDEVEQLAKTVMKQLGSKVGTQNIDRILRLPGTINYPNRVKRRKGWVKCRARLLLFHKSTCSLGHFPHEESAANACAAKHEQELPRDLQTLLYLKPGQHPYPTRSELLMAFLIKAIQQGIGDDVIVAACINKKYTGSAIYEHCAENQGERYVRRQIEKARKRCEAKPPSSGGEVVLVNAKDVIALPTDWLWEGHLARGEQEMMTGDPDVGKSLIHCDVVARVTTGERWPDGSRSREPGNVIMLTAEDTLATTVKPRLIAAGANLERVHFLDCIKTNDKEHYFLLSDHLDALEKKINEIGNVPLITIDPITAYQGKINSSSATDVRGQLGPLKGLAARTNVAISSITHPPKRPGEHWVSQFIGSQAYIAAARIGHVCVLQVRWDDHGNKIAVSKDEQRVFYISTKGNLMRMTPRTLVFRRQEKTIEGGIKTACIAWEKCAINFTVDEALAAAKPPPRTARIDNWLQQQLAEGPLPQQAIMEAGTRAGFSEDQLIHAKKRLGIKPHKGGLQEGWYWSLPDNDKGRNWKAAKL